MACEEKPRIMVSSAGYYFPDESSDHNLNTHSNQLNQFQNFESNSNPDHNYNLTTDMEMIGYFPTKNPSSTTASNWHDDQINRSFDLVDDSSLARSFVFPSTQGLSLSLNPTNIIPSTIGLQSFDQNTRFVPSTNSRSDHGFFGKSVMEDGFFGKGGNGVFQIRNSEYLGPAQELLNEFCNLGIAKETEAKTMKTKPHSRKSTEQWQSESGSSSKKQSLSSLELLELQKRKTKLISMLQEVDRRYNHYRNQMKSVVSSFESVAGNGTAAAYSALASKAMSRHFRCLRDGIVGQIKATKAAMGDKDATTTAAPGATRGETPRLRVLEQSMRQQAFHQMNLTEAHHPWRTQRGLPERAVAVLRAWLFEHFLHPYPSDVDKHILARQTGLSRSQVTNWFINARVRLWKPMVEDMYLEETKGDDQLHNHGGRRRPEDQSPPTVLPDDRKPERNQLTRIDSECLSSIINHPENMDSTHTNINSPQKHPPQQRHGFSSIGDTFGSVELDFSSYNHHHHHQNFGGGGGSSGGGRGGVSLTLGLQQHDGHGVVENSLVYGRGSDLGDCQTLAYRNLMGAQLLHDLGG